jgi:maleylacetate reductase
MTSGRAAATPPARSGPGTTLRFVHDTLPQRVRFATGEAAADVQEELAALGARRVMVVAGKHTRALAERVLRDHPVQVWHDEVAMHVPVPVAERARAVATGHDVDVVVSVGGGSTTGLAKAVALTSGIPVIAVPTTYAGSEATDVWGLTDGEVKTTGRDPRVLPRTVVYDAELTLGLPVQGSVASGLNALAHCVDSLWAPRTDPIDVALALEGVRALAGGLRGVVADPGGLRGREQTLYGAYLAAVAFASAGSGLHHKICHVLGGAYGLPHAETHAVVLPHVLALNAHTVPAAARRLAHALGAGDPQSGPGAAVAELGRLRADLDAPRALREYGLAEAELGRATDRCLAAVPPSNPVPVDRDRMADLLRAAWAGEEPVLDERSS